MRAQENERRIKILYIYPSLSVGGAEELHFLVLKNLLEKGIYDLKVCCIEEMGEIAQRVSKLGVEVFCLNKASKPLNISATISLVKYLKKNKFDIVQTSLFNANFHGRIAAILAKVPIILSEEHSEHYQYNSIKFLPYIWADKILSVFTDKIICCSRNLMDSLAKLENIPKGKFFLLLNTFNAEKLVVKRDAKEVRVSLGLSNEDLVITNIAALSFRKGQDLLIKAFKMINDRFPHSKLIFVGSEVPYFKKELEKLTDYLGISDKIIFLGQKADIADFLNITDIFVLSSRFEGIPLVLLEAMYMQVPVVAIDVGGIREVVINDKNGILVEQYNEEALSRALAEILNNKEKRSSIGQEGRKTIIEQFDEKRYISRLEDMYSQLLKNKYEQLFR